MDPALAAYNALTETRQKALREATSRGDSTIAQFYQDCTVFLTGGSGFLGKQLIEKLFRSCNVKKIYVLMRTKKGKIAQERLKDILLDPAFETLHKERPDFVARVVAVEGDVCELKLGLSDGDWRSITEEVNVIFHVAASTQFNKDLASATICNVRGTREVLHLARGMKQLRSVVHVSTAFSHATTYFNHGEVNEKFYKVPIAPEALIELAENNITEQLQDIVSENVGPKWPNTYTFTKAVAEEAIRTMAGGLPVCIVRPTIVIPAYREPSVGWMDLNSVYGGSGILYGGMLGTLHLFWATPNVRMDVVPVDIVNNVSIAGGWYTASNCKHDNNVIIYTATNTRNPMTCEDLHKIVYTRLQEFCCPRIMWYCFSFITDFKPVVVLVAWFLHYIPAYVVDIVLSLTGSKLRVTRIYGKVLNLMSAVSYFTTNCWIFGDENTLSLYNKLSPTDRDVFNFDMKLVDNDEMVVSWLLGLRKYIIKDELQGTEYGIRKQYWLRILHYLVMTGYLYIMIKIYKFRLNVFPIIRNIYKYTSQKIISNTHYATKIAGLVIN